MKDQMVLPEFGLVFMCVPFPLQLTNGVFKEK